MDNTEVTRAPAKTDAERQANHRERMRSDVEAGRVARYQVESFRQLVTRAGALGLAICIPPGGLPYDTALQSLNEQMLTKVIAAEKRRLEAAAADPESPFRPSIGVDAEGNSIDPPNAPEAVTHTPATEPPTKGRGKAVTTRKRAGK